MAHGDAREGKWRGNWRKEWVASTHTLPRNTVYPVLLPLMRTPRLPAVDWTDASRRFKWTRPFRRNTKSVFCACAITFQLASTSGRGWIIKCPSTRMHTFIKLGYVIICGPGSSVGIATELRAGRSGIESRWERDFPPVQTGPGTHPASCTMCTGYFLGVKCGRGVLLTTHPLLVPRSWKNSALPLPTLWVTTGL